MSAGDGINKESPMRYLAGSMNLYERVGDQPVNGLDPSGMVNFGNERDINPTNKPMQPGAPRDITTTGDGTHLRQLASGTLGYYRNYGWVDWNHANPTFPNRVLELVKAVTEGSNGPGHREKGEEGEFRLQMNPNRFAEAVAYPIYYYTVKCKLTDDEQKEVALAIFMDYNIKYEKWQSGWPVNVLTNSGFSQEDLPSDIIGFYMAVKKLSRENVEQLIGPQLGPAEAKALLTKMGTDLGLPRNKNYTFDPVDHNSEVGMGPRSIPDIFSSIKPRKKGDLWDYGFGPVPR
jgi:hypothetical protein